MKETVNVIMELDKVVQKTVKHYKSDFKYDQEMLFKYAQKNDKLSFLWLARDCGTFMSTEKTIFTKDSIANYTWLYYREDKSVCAYAIDNIQVKNNEIFGIVTLLNYREDLLFIEKNALLVKQRMIIWDSGIEIEVPYIDLNNQYLDRKLMEWGYIQKYGKNYTVEDRCNEHEMNILLSARKKNRLA